METKFNWCGYNWHTAYDWEFDNLPKANRWQDQSMVRLHGTQLELKTGYSPKEFTSHTANIGFGLITSDEYFGYGTFEIECLLPKGDNLWPAFWMWGKDSWPPEIDVFEAYPLNKSYWHWPWTNNWQWAKDWTLWNVEPRVHYGIQVDGHHPSTNTKHWPWTLKDPAKRFHKYKVVWDPNYIKIYYNGIRVKLITDPKVLEWFKDKQLRVVINNGVTDEANPKDCESSFIVNYFKYTQP